MKTPKAVWISSTEEEAKRLIQTFHSVKNGFFYSRGFLLLPFAHGSDVYLPRLDYSGVSVLSYTTYSDELDFSSKKAKKTIHAIQLQLLEDKPDASLDMVHLQKAFAQKQKKTLVLLHNFFPDDMKLLLQIRIIPSLFGTVGSFSYKPKGKKFSITVWVRTTGVTQEEFLNHAIHCIISAIVLRKESIFDKEKVKWYQREALIDYLCCNTALRDLFTKPVSTTHDLEKKDIDPKLLKTSNEYYKELGIKDKRTPITISNNCVYISNNPAGLFSPIESEIIKLLLEKKGEYIAVDELADAIYLQENEVYTLWSIAKHIQRIRKKFELLGVKSSIIQTKRNYGYRMI